MAGWTTADQRSKPRALDRIDRDKGCSIICIKPALNLMQNCDLPPPLKLFSGPDETFLSSISNIYSVDGGREDKDDEYKYCSGENDKLELLKALQLSQTRAREAERKLIALSKEKDLLSRLLIQDSLRMFANRQWVSLMEFQVVKLQGQQQGEEDYAASSCGDKSEDHDKCSGRGRIRHAAIAFCLAVAGMGFAFGCRYLF